MRTMIVLACVTLVVVAALPLALRTRRQVPAFATAKDLKDFALSNGLVFHCGNRNGIVSASIFLLADHPVSEREMYAAADLRACGLTPEWRGLLWVSQIRGSTTHLAPHHIGGVTRVWGNVVVAGDEDLIERIEELFRNQ